ncbi:alcohol dehydrogenase catalytic domain-containing protein [Comamonas testosteroni]|uniref:alcohol dehydrogenase catalytic domain-containing protein n=1 Tax=Comamonas testosteroni TaxID=285 RepID=UPI001E436D3B|nr:alcohol dehydrogenase catalytic domain-containing protein [Comamonas testosteroni]
MTKTMRAARLHEIGEPFKIDTVDVPDVRPTDVLVEVKAAGVVPNLHNVVTHYAQWFPFLPLPKLPAIYGLDSAGVVTQVGSQVRGIQPGDRVYVNPGLSCGACEACRRGDNINCTAYTFQGYFGFGPGSQQIFEDYPYAGFGQYMTAPAANLVKLPDSISFEQASRFGYLGTAYSALRKGQFAPGQTVLIDGGTGTLGLGAVILALAMGAAKIYVTARNQVLLERVRKIDPQRIVPIVLGSRPVADVVMDATAGYGVDVLIEALGPNAPVSSVLDAFNALRRGGKAINIGGVSDPIPLEPFPLMCLQKSYIGSLWFTTAEGQDMANMAHAGTLDLSVFDHERFSLEQVNEALIAVENRTGGFTNVVIMH